MSRALVIGKFMPPHNGHLALIRFAADKCGSVAVYVDVAENSPIPIGRRGEWLNEIFRDDIRITIVTGTDDLPQAGESSRDVSKVWADFLKKKFPETEVIVSSEKYGDYLAEYMGVTHISFDPSRDAIPISGTAVRDDPVSNWDYLPEQVRSFYLKKVCIYGPESTGKSTLTRRLAEHYSTVFVPEMAREVLGERSVNDIVYEDFPVIGEVHAGKIIEMEKKSRALLFSDTDILTTIIYSTRYFGQVPDYPSWVYEANKFNLYLFCDTDVPWVEDIHRNSGHVHDQMRECFMNELVKWGHPFVIISGGWNERLEAAVRAVDGLLKGK
jgi:HTH-type transcriptional repressor of NAD biosynthesis genes